jgi:hypothetical protein
MECETLSRFSNYFFWMGMGRQIGKSACGKFAQICRKLIFNKCGLASSNFFYQISPRIRLHAFKSELETT